MWHGHARCNLSPPLPSPRRGRGGALLATPCLVALLSCALVDASMPPQPLPSSSPMVELIEGNKKWVEMGRPDPPTGNSLVHHLAQDPVSLTRPKALVISCARSYYPIESIFNARPGELQVIRVCGFVSNAHDSVIGSVEFALDVEKPPPVLIVLGNSFNDVVMDAMHLAMVEAGRASPDEGSDIRSDSLVAHVLPAARDALLQEPDATFDRLCDVAGRLNVWRTIERILSSSSAVHQKVQRGELQVDGAYLDVRTGRVSMLGSHPCHGELLLARPTMKVRSASSPHVPYDEALAACVAGNRRYALGKGGQMKIDHDILMRGLSEGGQNPVSVVLGCADSRAPIERFFDMMPGDLFVLRNAGNTCAYAKGSVIGSAEYAVASLGTKAILVLGHTKCGAVTAAVNTVLSMAPKKPDGSLDVRAIDLSELDLGSVAGSIGDVLRDIVDVASMAIKVMPTASIAEQVALAIEYNVFETMEKILEFSNIVSDEVRAGRVQLFGGVYDILSGEVRWLGPHPELERIMGQPLPVHVWKTSPYQRQMKLTLARSPVVQDAIKQLQEGNERFVLSNHCRAQGFAEKPSAIVVAGSEVRVPLELIFDSKPGELVVHRTMGNIAGTKGGTLFSSVEYAVKKWSPQLLVVVGESNSAIIDKAFAQLDGDVPLFSPSRAIVDRVLVAAKRASEQLSNNIGATLAGQEMLKRQLTVELNVLYSIEQLLASPILSQAVRDGRLEVHGAILNCATGMVQFIGEHPVQAEICRLGLNE